MNDFHSPGWGAVSPQLQSSWGNLPPLPPPPGSRVPGHKYDWYVCHGSINSKNTFQFESTTSRNGYNYKLCDLR